MPANTPTNIVIAHANNGTGDNDIKLPGTVKAVFVSASLYSDTATGVETMGVLMAKLPGGSGLLSDPNGVLDAFTQQQTFLWLRMTPRTQNFGHQFIGWVKIPPRHQIFNETDQLVWRMSMNSVYNHCTNFVYKHR